MKRTDSEVLSAAISSFLGGLFATSTRLQRPNILSYRDSLKLLLKMPAGTDTK